MPNIKFIGSGQTAAQTQAMLNQLKAVVPKPSAPAPAPMPRPLTPGPAAVHMAIPLSAVQGALAARDKVRSELANIASQYGGAATPSAGGPAGGEVIAAVPPPDMYGQPDATGASGDPIPVTRAQVRAYYVHYYVNMASSA